MSEVSNSSEKSKIYSDGIIEIAEEGIERAAKLLGNAPGLIRKAVGSALARAGKAGQTYAKRAVTKEYTISQGTFMRYTRNINHFNGKTSSDLSVVFGFQGSTIPLIQFSSQVSKTGVIVNVRKDTGPQPLDRAFFTHVNSHLGIYERITMKRLPIQEFYGPATPQMMYSNEEVMDKIDDKVAETFEKRIEHEITRVLNGW